MNKILIIGGNGYIGTYLTMKLINFYNIYIVDKNPIIYNKNEKINYINTDFNLLDKEFYSQFESIILLAGQSSVSNSKNLDTVVNNNISNFSYLLNIINNEQKFIYASSSSVYGNTNENEVNENSLFNEPYNFYDFSKQTIDNLAKLSDKNYYALRFGTVNGFSPNFRNDLMINSMIYNAKKNGKIFVYNKDINRAILGINDLCNCIKLLLENNNKELKGVYNINSFNSTVNDISLKVSEKCNVEIEYIDNVNNIINYKLQTKSYNFKINSNKFEKNFNYKFSENIDSIIDGILDNWNNIENFENRINDVYKSYKELNTCLVCDNKTKLLISFGEQDLANNYSNNIYKKIKYPLELTYCNNCYHVQINSLVDPNILFKNYCYLSGTSNTLKTYFDYFSKYSLERLNIQKDNLKILDIACNDGSLLNSFEKINNNFKRVGVDPAENIFLKNNTTHDIYCNFFNQDIVNLFKEKYDKFDLIIAQNVFAHINYPNEFLKYCNELLSENGIIFIQTSQKNMISNNEFDTVYHEHISFFNTNSMNILCKKNNLILNKITSNEIHGTSYIFEIRKYKTDDNNLYEILNIEKNNGLYNNITYEKYKLKCLAYKNMFHNKLINYKLNNYKIIGFGSTAKSNTLLSFCNIDNSYIDWIIDENYLKQNLYTPNTNIIIKDINSLEFIDNNYIILVLAWNFYEEIKNKIKIKINNKIKIKLLNIYTLQEDEI